MDCRLITGTLYLLLHVLLVVADTCPPDRDQEVLHDEGKLHQDLLCAYHSDYRPVKDHKTTVTVKIRLALKYINFDALEETFTVHSWVAMMWKDEFLSWTPSNYGGIEELQIESHEIWTPRMALFNADAALYQTDTIYTTCLVAKDGFVTCVPHIAHSGICRSSLRSWPYDSQNCSLYFGSWMHTGEQVNFTFYSSQPVVTSDYQDGPAWKLLNVANERLPGKYRENTTYPMLKYTFVMKREAAGPAAIVVVPAIVIVLLTLASLLLDVKDNIRLILACFSLFGHFTFLTQIGYDIPKHSSDTPIILLFLRDSMIVTLMAILVTLFLMSLRRQVVPAPTWVVSITRLVSNGPGKYVMFTEFDPNDTSDKRGLAEVGTSTEVTDDDRSRVTGDWMQFANLLNSFVFAVSVLVYLILIFAYIPYN